MNSLEEIALKVAKETDAHLGECVSRDSAIWAYENARRLVAALGAQEPTVWVGSMNGHRYIHWGSSAPDFPALTGVHPLFSAPVLPSVEFSCHENSI